MDNNRHRQRRSSSRCLCHQHWPSLTSVIIMAVVVAAVVNAGHSCGRCRRQHRPSSRPLPSSTSMQAGAIASPSRTMRGGSKRPRGTTLINEGRAVVDSNVGVEYVSFFNGYASDVYIYFHHPYSSSSSSTPLQLHSLPKCS